MRGNKVDSPNYFNNQVVNNAANWDMNDEGRGQYSVEIKSEVQCWAKYEMTRR